MAYAIRFNGPKHIGMLVEMRGSALDRIIMAQKEADDLRHAYWENMGSDDHDRDDHPVEEPPITYPYYETIGADRAHGWVKKGLPHETLLYTEDGRIRRA